jgi:hypothetical protein
MSRDEREPVQASPADPGLIAQASLLQQNNRPSAPSAFEADGYTRPQIYQPNPAERQFLQGIGANPPVPADPNANYALPNNINDVGGRRGNGYASPDDAARAVASSLNEYTTRSGHEAGAWIVSKEVQGQERFFVIAASQGQNNAVDLQQAYADLNTHRQNNPNDNFRLVSHIHSHPVVGFDQQGQPGLIGEGPSRNDYNGWAAANMQTDPKTKIGNTGYIVSGDGDVYRLNFPGINTLSEPDVNAAQRGLFSQNSIPTLSRIGDVTPSNDNPLTPNLWASANGRPAAMLPQSQVRDEVTLISNQAHPDHRMFQQAMTALQAADPQKLGSISSEQRENLAASLTAEARQAGLSRIDSVALSNDGSRVFAVQGRPDDPAAQRTGPVDKAQAMNESVQSTSERLLNAAPNLPAPTETRNQMRSEENPAIEAVARSR